jgi:flagellin-specific chaperone FliS
MQLRRHLQKKHFDYFECVIFKNYPSVNELEEQLAKDALLEMQQQLFGLEDYMVLVDNDLKVI